MPQIFVSYRRDELPDLADRIFDSLFSRFGRGRVFRDIGGVTPGTEFPDKIGEALRESKVVVALVGSNWLGTSAGGVRRIDDETDWVRTEIQISLALNIPIVPVVINRAQMPRASELPEPLKRFSRIQSLPLESGRTFETDVDQLSKIVQQYLKDGLRGPLNRWFGRILSPRKSKGHPTDGKPSSSDFVSQWLRLCFDIAFWASCGNAIFFGTSLASKAVAAF
jgi:hypothetical protein